MGKFKEKIFKLMYGRYGTDELYYFLFVLFFALWIFELITVAILPNGVASQIVSTVFSILISLLIFFMIFRTMSRNIYKRRRENEVTWKPDAQYQDFSVEILRKKQRTEMSIRQTLYSAIAHTVEQRSVYLENKASIK